MAKILIIGGGVAGLSAGIYAQLNGHQAVVCEKHFIPGGNLTGWQRGEYHIDNCIHWLTGTNPASRFYNMWNDLGALGDIEVMQGESLYTCEADGVTLGLYTDLERIRREMLSISPEDKKEINSLIRAVKIMQRVDGIGGKNNDQKMSIGQLISGFPTLLKFYSLTTGQLATLFCESWGNGQTYEVLSKDGPHEANFLKLDCDKLKAVFGWEPGWSAPEAVKKTVEWTKVYASGGDVPAKLDEQINEFFNKG